MKLKINTTYKITATPREGYHVDSIEVDEGAQTKQLELYDGEAGAKYTAYPVIATTKSITANFVKDTDVVEVPINGDSEPKETPATFEFEDGTVLIEEAE